jgi:hypothetical protein
MNHASSGTPSKEGKDHVLVLEAVLLGPVENRRADRMAEGVREALDELLDLRFSHAGLIGGRRLAHHFLPHTMDLSRGLRLNGEGYCKKREHEGQKEDGAPFSAWATSECWDATPGGGPPSTCDRRLRVQLHLTCQSLDRPLLGDDIRSGRRSLAPVFSKRQRTEAARAERANHVRERAGFAHQPQTRRPSSFRIGLLQRLRSISVSRHSPFRRRHRAPRRF